MIWADVRRMSLPGIAAALLACAAMGQAAPEPPQTPADAAARFRAPRNARVRPNGWFPERKSKNRPALPDQVDTAFIIPIHGAIGKATYAAIARKVVRCRSAGAQMIVFDMNTPGGESGAMLKIGRLIVDDLKDTTTVAYVNPHAFSAGAIISFACDEIVMKPSGVIGAATPLMMGPQGIVQIPKDVRAKLESAYRAEARAWVQQNGYNPDLCQATITVSMEIWLIRNRRGELQVVDAREWHGSVNGVPGETADETLVAAKTQGPWQYIRTVAGPEEPVSMTADEAYAFGLIDHRFESMAHLKTHYHFAAEPVVLEDNWSEGMVAFLTSPAVLSALFFLAILCGYIEMNTPGFGIPGLLAVVFLGLAFGGQFLVGMALWWEIALILVGVTLIGIEIFIIPGFTVAGVLGGLCLIVGLVGAIVPNAPNEWPLPRTDLAWDSFATGALALGIAFIVALVAMPLVSKLLPRIPVAGKLVIAPAEVFTGAPVADASPMTRIGPGDTGVVEAICRPVGKVRFGDDIVDAMTEGGIIETGARVCVLRREGNRLVIQRTG